MTDTKNPDAGRKAALEWIMANIKTPKDCPCEILCTITESLQQKALAQSQPPVQGHVSAIEGLDEAIEFSENWMGDICTGKFTNNLNKVIEASRRYSELARGKGGG